MIRNACLWAVLTATLAFAQKDGAPRCDNGHESKHPAPTDECRCVLERSGGQQHRRRGRQVATAGLG